MHTECTSDAHNMYNVATRGERALGVGGENKVRVQQKKKKKKEKKMYLGDELRYVRCSAHALHRVRRELENDTC